ncbi:hypothetical protein [Streptomyces sp. GS7]|uniref:hypothetical protein n=1 Tax=Streptomyces sp. GS7 TaxID=2692234 RepID=UPI001315C4AE|nr:hypothetical protein [Streptomyces sp. GS7]QHC24007.1 hypothetical protein GR130_24170 [Streptomyces sp. GS7]
MHENDRLEAQDAPEFERTLDRALNSPEVREALQRTSRTLNSEQLRSEALGARAAITAGAAAEYREFVRLRAATTPIRPVEPATGTGTQARSGGLLPALGVLVPGLAATAAAVFLLFGFGLRAVASPSPLADELITAGWTSAGVAGVATLTGLVWVLAAAARNRAAADARTPEDADPETARAHAAWQLALLERGIMPFLLGRLDTTLSGGGSRTGRPALPRPAAAGVSGGTGEGRPVHTDGPGFSSPDFSGPDFGSPDFSGPKAPGAQ